jgi:membrane protein DedA with SNARE-associated domain
MLATLAFEHTEWIFFAWILANQAGVPVPAVPALLWAGTLLESGRLNLVVILALSVGASLAADLVWYGLGRWRGPQALELLPTFAEDPDLHTAGPERLPRARGAVPA